MSEAEILELTYDCTCKIIRKVSTKDVTTGITITEDEVIVDNVKCAVTKTISTSSSVNSEIGSISSNLKLFTNPSIDIQAGDTIEVANQIAEKTIYLASKPFHYISHKEIGITEKDRV